MFQSFRVRKLTGKPAFLAIADCEFKARRIQNPHTAVFSPLAAKSNAFRIHSEVIFFTGCRALRIMPSSSCESLACTSLPRTLDFGFFGLPIFGFIKYFLYDENSC